RQRDRAAGLTTDDEALHQLQAKLQGLAEDESRLCDAWERQRALAGRLLELRRQLAAAEEAETRAALAATQAELDRLQAGQPLVSHEVSPRLVAEVISHWTGIPVSQLAREHSTRVARFADDLRHRIRCQEQAVYPLGRSAERRLRHCESDD